MTGQILFQTSALNNGFRWDVNSDAAGITFKNTGDGDSNSYFNFFTEDNGNEYFKFSHNHYANGSKDWIDIKDGVIRTNGDIYVNASQSGTRSAGTNELINGSRVWHAGDFSSTNISNWNTAYGWGNHASAGYVTNVVTSLGYTPVTNARTLTINGTGYDLTANRSWSVGTVTSVGGTGTVSGLTLSGTVTGSGNLTLGGTLSLTSSNVTTALGYTPYNSSNPNGYITGVTDISGYSYNLFSQDVRTLAPSNHTAYRLNFGFTSWANNNTSPYADYLHLRSYSDASGGADNLVMFKKSGIGMRIWQQTWGSGTAYSSYADVWTSGDFSSTNISNWNTAYGWGNHASAGYVPGARSITINGTAYNLSADRSWSVGTVTSVGGTGTVSGLTLTGTVTGSGNLTLGGTLSLTSANVTTALGFTPYSSTNPSGYITGITSANVTTALGFTPYNATNPSGYITGITSSNVTTALGYTPATNTHDHDGRYVRSYTTTNDNIDSDWGQSFKTFDPIPSGTPPIQSPNLRTINIGENFSRRTQLAFNYATDQAWFRRNQDSTWYTWREFIHSGNIGSQSVSYATSAGSLSSMNISQFTNNSGYLTGITSGQVTTALGFTPYNSTNPSGYTSNTGTVTSVSGTGTVSGLTLSGTVTGSGNLTLGGTLSLTSGNVTGALGYTPYNSSNPSGYITGITYNQVVNALGYTPANSSSSGISQATADGLYVNVTGDTMSGALIINAPTQGAEAFAVNGVNGRLFTVVDDLTDSLYSVNTIAGLPVLEIFANNVVQIGKFGTNAIYVGQDGRVGFGTTDFSYTASDNSGATGVPTNNRVYVNGSIQLLSNSDGIVFGRGTSTYLKDEDLSFGWGGGWYMTDGTYLRVRGNKMVYSGGSARFDGSVYLGGETYRFYYANSGTWTNGNFGAEGDIYFGTRGTWLSSYLNQALLTSSAPTFTDVYNNSWFRNNANNTGLYNQANGNHFYSRSATAWGITGNGGSVVHLQFRINHESTLRGSVYGDGSGFGLLDSGDNWRVRVDTGGAQVYGTLTVGNTTSSNIVMTDTDENTRTIHCNSGRIGFLTSGGSWGAYADNSGNWNAANFSGSHSGTSSGTNTGDQTNISGNAGTVTINYNNDSNSTYQLLWGSGNSVYGTGGVYVNPYTDTVYASAFSGSLAWTNVTGRPTALSSFTNDLGNYGGWITSSGSISGTAATATRTSGQSGYPHAGTGMWAFYNWGGSNGGASAPTSGTYTTGISVGSHPSDQAYGFQIANNMWNTGLWTRNYNSGFGDWIRLLDGSNHPYAASMNQYVNTSSDPTFNSIYLANGNLRLYQGDGTALRVVTAYGWMNLGAQNGSWTHMYASQDFYFNRNLYVNGTQVVTNSGTWSINVSGSAGSATSASYASYLPTAYAGGQQTNPQVYFNDGIGLKAAMTGAWSVWSDTLWINGYSGSDVRWMCALHFLRNSEPRMAISAQTSNSGSYGSYYEVITAYNIGSQSVSYASTAGNANNISSAVGGSYSWTGSNYFVANRNTTSDSPPLQAYSNNGGGAIMSFHRGGQYAVNFGLDSDNVMRIGGWSASANRWQLDMSGNMTVAGDVTAYSDARVKENVKTIENALDKTLALRGVSYNRTDSGDTKTKIGVIAQETLEVVPEVVNQDNDGMYNVSYGNMTALLIEAIKEQQAQIEDLKSEIKKLRGE
jgi:hypothetical protein